MHFYYNYKENLGSKLKEVYRRELKALDQKRKQQKQLDIAQEIIEKYFDRLASEIEDVVNVSEGQIQFIKNEDVIMKFIMYNNYVRFSRFEQGIEVEIGVFDEESGLIEGRITSNIIPSDKRCVVKKIGKIHDRAHFDENTINHYMSEAFSHIEILKD